MKKVIVDDKPFLCLFATEDIKTDEELRYNYGVTNLPWENQVCELILFTHHVRIAITSINLSVLNFVAGRSFTSQCLSIGCILSKNLLSDCLTL